MALGAPKGVVLRAVLLEGAMMTLIGMVGGAAIAALFSGDHQTEIGTAVRCPDQHGRYRLACSV